MFLVKQGVPSDEDLEWLSQKLENWKTVGRRLEIDEARLTAFDDENFKIRGYNVEISDHISNAL